MGVTIQPGIGRNVWFYTEDHPKNEQPFHAVITYVFSDRCVNLAIFKADGNILTDPPVQIPLVQPGKKRPEKGCWCEWLPHQIEVEGIKRTRAMQAKKREEKKLQDIESK